MPKDAKPADDTEKGFGTGLRAQLQLRRDSAQGALDASNAAFEAGKAVATAPASANGNGDGHAEPKPSKPSSQPHSCATGPPRVSDRPD